MLEKILEVIMDKISTFADYAEKCHMVEESIIFGTDIKVICKILSIIHVQEITYYEYTGKYYFFNSSTCEILNMQVDENMKVKTLNDSDILQYLMYIK